MDRYGDDDNDIPPKNTKSDFHTILVLLFILGICIISLTYYMRQPQNYEWEDLLFIVNDKGHVITQTGLTTWTKYMASRFNNMYNSLIVFIVITHSDDNIQKILTCCPSPHSKKDDILRLIKDYECNCNCSKIQWLGITDSCSGLTV